MVTILFEFDFKKNKKQNIKVAVACSYTRHKKGKYKQPMVGTCIL